MEGWVVIFKAGVWAIQPRVILWQRQSTASDAPNADPKGCTGMDYAT